MRITLLITTFLFLFPALLWGNGNGASINDNSISTPLKIKSPLKVNSIYDGSLFRLNNKMYTSFGTRNLLLDYNGTIQVKNWFELGIGFGIHNNRVKLHSASDSHVIKNYSTPTYLTATIYAYHDQDKAFYIKGNYGRANNQNDQNNKVASNFKGKMIQGGIGFKTSKNRDWHIELSQYYSSAKGTYSSTYDSSIDYNLEHYAIILSIGINLIKN